MLSSAKFANLALFIKRNKSFIKMLNKIGPSMEPCGTPDNRILKILSLVFFLVSNTKMLKLHWLIHINEVLQ